MHTVKCILYSASCEGEPSLKKNGKIWEKFLIRLDPPPSDNSEYFEFQKLLKNSDPPSLGLNSEMFEIENISKAADPL